VPLFGRKKKQAEAEKPSKGKNTRKDLGCPSCNPEKMVI